MNSLTASKLACSTQKSCCTTIMDIKSILDNYQIGLALSLRSRDEWWPPLILVFIDCLIRSGSPQNFSGLELGQLSGYHFVWVKIDFMKYQGFDHAWWIARMPQAVMYSSNPFWLVFAYNVCIKDLLLSSFVFQFFLLIMQGVASAIWLPTGFF